MLESAPLNRLIHRHTDTHRLDNDGIKKKKHAFKGLVRSGWVKEEKRKEGEEVIEGRGEGQPLGSVQGCKRYRMCSLTIECVLLLYWCRQRQTRTRPRPPS